MVDGRYSPPPAIKPNPHCFTMDIGMPVVPSNLRKEKPPINVVGDVGGRIAIMVVSIKIGSRLARVSVASALSLSSFFLPIG